MSTPILDGLRELPLSERRNALEELVVADFKSVLYMTDDEDFPARESFFDLGLTSLRLTEIKERLEALLGRPVSANSLFNSPTLESLLGHLTDEVLPDLFHAPRTTAEQTAASQTRAGQTGAGQTGAEQPAAGSAPTGPPDGVDIGDLLGDLYRA